MIIDLKKYPACFPVSTEAPEPFRDGFLETLRQASTMNKLSRSLSRRAGAITTAQYTASIAAPPDNDTLQSQQVGNNLETGYAIIARSVGCGSPITTSCGGHGRPSGGNPARENKMKSEKVLDIVLREITAYGRGYRLDWSEFDGRTLRHQLNGIAFWAREALAGRTDCEYTLGTLFYKEKIDG